MTATESKVSWRDIALDDAFELGLIQFKYGWKGF